MGDENPESVETSKSHCLRCERDTFEVINSGRGILVIRCQHCGYLKARRLIL